MAYVKVGSSKSATACLTYGEFKDKKRREDVVIGGVNCRAESAKAEFKAVRFLWHQENGIQAHTVIQSFDDEITMEQANEIGKKTAKRLAREHQAVVFTHNDGDGGKIHNHIVINAVNMKNGSKINTSRFLYRARDISNEICREANLHIIKEQKAKLRYTQAEQGIVKRKEISWKDEIRETVEKAKNICSNIEEFTQFLLEQGIRINERNTKKEKDGKAWTYYHKNGGRIRAVKLGDDYTRSEVLGALLSINKIMDKAIQLTNLAAEQEKEKQENEEAIKQEQWLRARYLQQEREYSRGKGR